MVNHIYDEATNRTVCGEYAGELARSISGPNYSCPDCLAKSPARRIDIAITNLRTTPDEEAALVDLIWSLVSYHHDLADIAVISGPDETEAT